MKTADTIHMRLVNGDEIIAELHEITDNEIRVMKPMVVSEKEDPRSKTGTIILSKYVLFNDEEYVGFQRIHVVTLTDVMEEIKSYYKNSVDYSTKVIEPIVKREIMKVNNMMEQILYPREELEIPVQGLEPRARPVEKPDDDIRIIYTPSSNTIH